jgi:hypothetical protein
MQISFNQRPASLYHCHTFILLLENLESSVATGGFVWEFWGVSLTSTLIIF